ncbi:hypothetical protein [Cyanobium sp. CH-040]|uniref:hypothetical protein n=1 Tax=Cyanobium sp. CH-040 TaxID=2823708 RepID=UPI0020CC5B39|nr:hypothetical protein [Cyanobium sp. CH-040]
MAAVALLAGTAVGCGSGPQEKDDGEGGEPKIERTSPENDGSGKGREEESDEEKDDDDDDDEDS